MNQISRRGWAVIFLSFAFLFSSCLDAQAAFWFSKKKEEPKKVEVKKANPPDIGVRTVVKTRSIVPGQTIQRSASEVKIFNNEIFKQRGDFEKKLARMPVGPRAQLQLDLNKEVQETRRKAQLEINAMSKDEKELLRAELAANVRQLQAELEKKIKTMPPTAKELKRREYQDLLDKRRRDVDAQIRQMPLDERDQARLDFEAEIAKKMKEFYQG